MRYARIIFIKFALALRTVIFSASKTYRVKTFCVELLRQFFVNYFETLVALYVCKWLLRLQTKFGSIDLSNLLVNVILTYLSFLT